MGCCSNRSGSFCCADPDGDEMIEWLISPTQVPEWAFLVMCFFTGTGIMYWVNAARDIRSNRDARRRLQNRFDDIVERGRYLPPEVEK